jgi:hypothetical protein
MAYNNATGALVNPPAAQATGATSGTARTMLQIAPASTTSLRIIEWGYTLDSAPTNPVRIELVDTGTIFASGLTAHVAAGIHKYNVPSGAASTVQLGAALTGYSAGSSTEGTTTVSRLLGYQYENGLYFKQQFPLGREPEVVPSNCLRIRATPTSAASVNLTCYIIWEE